jgi:hypothetical protein
MLKLMLAVSALAAALAVPVAPVQAVTLPQVERPQSQTITVGRRGHFRHHFHGPRFHHHRHRGFRRFHYGFVGAPVYFHSYYYRGGCGWLRRRALITGSPYWWHRYRACRYGW